MRDRSGGRIVDCTVSKPRESSIVAIPYCYSTRLTLHIHSTPLTSATCWHRESHSNPCGGVRPPIQPPTRAAHSQDPANNSSQWPPRHLPAGSRLRLPLPWAPPSPHSAGRQTRRPYTARFFLPLTPHPSQKRRHHTHDRRPSLGLDPRQTAPEPPRRAPSQHLQAANHLVRLRAQPRHRRRPLRRLLRFRRPLPDRACRRLAPRELCARC
jgi:hypothetical protein